MLPSTPFFPEALERAVQYPSSDPAMNFTNVDASEARSAQPVADFQVASKTIVSPPWEFPGPDFNFMRGVRTTGGESADKAWEAILRASLDEASA